MSRRLAILGCGVLAAAAALAIMAGMQPKEVAFFELDELLDRSARGNTPYSEFFNDGAFRCGIYELKAGAEDRQTPHAEDEVYHVLRGKAVLEAAGERRVVGPGSLVFVREGVSHRFVDIEEDLAVLVLFADAPR